MIEFDKMRRMLSEHRQFASPMQVARFVLEASSAGTWYGFYVQALREMHSRVRSLQGSLLSLTVARRDLDGLRADRSGRDADVAVRRKEIEVDELEHSCQSTYKQLDLIYRYAEHARTKLPATLDARTRDALDREFWTKELAKRSLLEKLSGQPTSIDVWRTVLAMPEAEGTKAREAIFSSDLDDAPFKLDLPDFLELDGIGLSEPARKEIERC